MKKKLLILTLAILGLAILPQYVFAEIQEELESAPEEKTVNDLELSTSEEEVDVDDSFQITAGEDVFLANEVISYSKDVDGDLFAFGSTVTIDGDVEGDAFIGGGTVIVNGEIKGDLFIAGGKVSIYSPVGGKVMIGAGTVTIDSNVKEDVYIGANTVMLAGNFGDDVRVGAETLDIRGVIADDLHANVREFKKSVGSEIGGVKSVVITERDEGNVEVEPSRFKVRGFSAWQLFKKTLVTIGWVLAAMLVVKLGPVKTDNLLQRLDKQENWFTGFGLGLIALLVALPLGIFLFITVIGIPIAILGGISFAFIMLISSLVAKVWVGLKALNVLKQKTTNYCLAAIIGVLLVELLSLIPLLGWMLKTILMTVALGTFLQLKWDMYQKSRE